MYKPKVFLVGEGKGNLITLEESGYLSESILQELLTDYPDLLPGDQITPEDPRRWLFVAREVSIPGDETESERWSLDHLFLDQDGVPTFVECKRSIDSRTRREVIAQMLDYAANGTAYWSMDRLRRAAAETAKKQGKSLDDEVLRVLGENKIEIDQFWGGVEANLRNHKIRLIFVSDSTPKELRRLVEFLNEEMLHVEVLAVEVKQFQGRGGEKDQKALVPRVLGLTESARGNKKPPIMRTATTAEIFLGKCGPGAREFFQRVLDLAKQRGHTILWGTVGFSVRTDLPSGLATFVYGVPPNQFQFYFNSGTLRDEKVSPSFREKLLGFDVFRQAGEWTLKSEVGEDNLAKMNDLYDFILEQIEGLRPRP